MEKHLLKLFKLADELNEKQDNIYAEIHYCADNSKKLEISIRNKENYAFIEKCEIQLKENSIIKWENVISLLEVFVGGVSDE